MATPDTKHSIVITKSMPYRGAGREFGNRYHFEGALPTDAAAWAAFADLIVAAEKQLYKDDFSIVRAVGYDAGSASSTNPHGDSVFSKTYTTAGTYAPSGGEHRAPGDCAALIRWSTAARSSRNHPVYLMNYYHGVYADSGTVDGVAALQLAAYQDYGDAWVTGFMCDGTDRERCGPRGAAATRCDADPVIRHRDFPN